MEKPSRSPGRFLAPPVACLALFFVQCGSAPDIAPPPASPQAAPPPPKSHVAMASSLAPEASLESEPEAATSPVEPACPEGMVLVDGMYCPNVRQTCLSWVDPPGDRYHFTRCAEFKEPGSCEGARVHKRYCIDRNEYVRPPEVVPLVNVSWLEAQTACEGRAAALCSESQWELACEGDQLLPYPYGYKRDAGACNFDRTDLGKMGDGLADHRTPPESFPRCVSPFGVNDMVGNVDEWTLREGMTPPRRSALHGGWWLPGRNNCRAATLEHGEDYYGKQVGFRCCAPVRPSPAPSADDPRASSEGDALATQMR